MLLNSKSKVGSLTDVHAESAKYILGKGSFSLHKNQFLMKKHQNITTKTLVFQSCFVFKCSTVSA